MTKPSKAATATIRAIWANMAARSGLECLGEVEQRTARDMRRELAAIVDRHMAKDKARLDAVDAGEWDISADHHCGGFSVYNRGKLIGNGGNNLGVRAAIDDAMKGAS